nr:hypothetical protein TetV2_00060 [Oceanusvirus sp.]
MPSFTIPSLSNNVFHDGGTIAAYDSVVPILLVVDANNKVAAVRGDPIFMADVEPPVFDTGLTVDIAAETQITVSWALSDAGDTVIAADTKLYLGVYQLAAPLPTAQQIRGETAVASLVRVIKVPDGKTVSSVVVGDGGDIETGGGGTALDSRVTYYFRATAEDDVLNLQDDVSVASATTTDVTAPAVNSFEATSSNENSFTLEWDISDAGDANAGTDTALYIGVYDSASAPNSAQVVAGSGTDFNRLIPVANARTGAAGAAASEVVGDSTPGSDTALSPSVTYHVYAVSVDDAGNSSAVPEYVEVTTTDETAPANLGSVQVIAGPDSATEITFTNLNAINDNVDIAELFVLYNTINDFGSADSNEAVVGDDDFTVSGLEDITRYYCWTRAADSASNVAGPTAVFGGSITTTDGTAPVVSGVGATQTADQYEFAAANIAGTIQDNFVDAGNTITAYFLLSDQAGLDQTALDPLKNAGGTRVISASRVNSTAAAFGIAAMGTWSGTGTVDQFYNGSGWTAIDETNPADHLLYAYVLAEDAAGNAGYDRSDATIAVLDETAPAVSAVDAAQDAGQNVYSFTIDAGTTVEDETVGAQVDVYFLMSSVSTLTTSQLNDRKGDTAQVASGSTGSHGGNPFAVASLGGMQVDDFWNGSAWAAISETTADLYAYVMAEDANSNRSSARSAAAIAVEDRTAPAFGGFAASDPTPTSVDLSWTAVSDSTDGTPDVIISAYTSDQGAISNADVRDGVGAVSSVTVVDANGTTSYSYGSTSLGEDELESSTEYYFYAVARDAAGNLTAVQSATQTTESGDFLFLAADPQGESNVSLAWDSGARVGDVQHIAAYVDTESACNVIAPDAAIASPPNPVIATDVFGASNAFSKIAIADHTVTGYLFGSGDESELELVPGTTFKFYGTLEDAVNGLTGIVGSTSNVTTEGTYEVTGFSNVGASTLSNVNLTWDPPEPAISSNIISAFQEDPADYNQYTVTVADDAFVFAPPLGSNVELGVKNVFDVSDPTNLGHQLSFTDRLDLGVDPASLLPGYHVNLEGTGDATFLANNAFSGNPSPSTFDFVDGELLAYSTIITFQLVSGPVGACTMYGLYEPSASVAHVFLRSTNEFSGWKFAGGNIVTSPSSIVIAPSASGYYFVCMRQSGTALTFDVWSENGTEITRDATDTGNGGASDSAFAPQIREGAKVKALGTINAVLTDQEVESIKDYVLGIASSQAGVYNTTAIGTAGNPGAVVEFVPRDLGATVYSYSVQDGASYGSSNTVTTDITSLAVYGSGTGEFADLATMPEVIDQYYSYYMFDKLIDNGLGSSGFTGVAADGSGTGPLGSYVQTLSVDGVAYEIRSSVPYQYGNIADVFNWSNGDPPGYGGRTEGVMYTINFTDDNTLSDYNGTTTTSTDQGDVDGDWVQLYSDEAVRYVRYGYWANADENDSYGAWVVCGSTDGANFDVLDRVTLTDVPDRGSAKEYPMRTKTGRYNYYRFIVTHLIGKTQRSFWTLKHWFAGPVNTTRLSAGDQAIVDPGTETITYGDNAYGDSNLEPGEHYHFLSILKHPTGLLAPSPAQAYSATKFYDVEGFANSEQETATSAPLEWTAPTLDTIPTGSIAIAAYEGDQTAITAADVYSASNAFSHAIIDGSEHAGLSSYDFGSGLYGETSLDPETTYHFYAVARSRGGVLSDVVASTTATTAVAILLQVLATTDSTASLSWEGVLDSSAFTLAAYPDLTSPCNLIPPDSALSNQPLTIAKADVEAGNAAFTIVTIPDGTATTSYVLGSGTYDEYALTPGSSFLFYGAGTGGVAGTSNVETTGTFAHGFPAAAVEQNTGALDMSTPIAGVSSKFLGNVALAPNGDVYWTQNDGLNGTARIYRSTDSGGTWSLVQSGGTIRGDNLYISTAVDPSGTYLYIFAANYVQNVNNDGFRGGFWRMTISDGTFSTLAAAIDTLSVNDSGNLTVKAIQFDSDNLPILSTGHRFNSGQNGQVHSYKWNGTSIDELGSPLTVSTAQINMAQSVRVGTDLYMIVYGKGGTVFSTYRYDLTTGTGGFWDEVGTDFSAAGNSGFTLRNYSIVADDDGVLWRAFYDYDGTGMRLQYNVDPLGLGDWVHATDPPVPNQLSNTQVRNFRHSVMLHSANKLYLAYIAIDTTLGGNGSSYTGLATYTISSDTWEVEDGIIQTDGRSLSASISDSKLYIVTQDSSYVPSGVVVTLGGVPATNATLSNVTLNWDAPVPEVCTTIISAYKEDYTASNLSAVTVVNGAFAFDPDLSNLVVGDRYLFDVSDASCLNHQLSFSNQDSEPYNTELTGTPGTADATVLFVPRAAGAVYSYSVEDGASYGAAYEAEHGVTALEVYTGASSSNDLVRVSTADISDSNLVTLEYGDETYGDSNLDPGEHYHFYGILKHPTGMLTPSVSHASYSTIYHNVENLQSSGSNDTTAELEWSSPSLDEITGSIVIAAFSAEQDEITPQYIWESDAGISGAVLDDGEDSVRWTFESGENEEITNTAPTSSTGSVVDGAYTGGIHYTNTSYGAPISGFNIDVSSKNLYMRFVLDSLPASDSFTSDGTHFFSCGNNDTTLFVTAAGFLRGTTGPGNTANAVIGSTQMVAGTAYEVIFDFANDKGYLNGNEEFTVPNHAATGVINQLKLGNAYMSLEEVRITTVTPAPVTVGPVSKALVDGSEHAGLSNYEFGSGAYGDTALEPETAYYFYAIARSPAGILSRVVAGTTAITTPSAPTADHEPDFAAALLPYSTDLGDDVVTASGPADNNVIYLDANPFTMSGQSMTFVSIARYSQDPATATRWYLSRSFGVGNRPRVTFYQTAFDISGGTTNATSSPSIPNGFFTSKFLFAFTFDAGTQDVTAYLVGKPGGTLTTYSVSAVTNVTYLDFASANLFWSPDSPSVAYLRKFRFWTSILSQTDIENVASSEL